MYWLDLFDLPTCPKILTSLHWHNTTPQKCNWLHLWKSIHARNFNSSGECLNVILIFLVVHEIHQNCSCNVSIVFKHCREVVEEWARCRSCLQRKHYDNDIWTKYEQSAKQKIRFQNIVTKSGRSKPTLGAVLQWKYKVIFETDMNKIRNTKYVFKQCRKVGEEWASTPSCLQRK